MKTFSICFNLIITFCFWVNLSYGNDHAPKNNLMGIEETIVSYISLINNIIKDPKEACMKNWAQLGNPHDETELMFYRHSISDGTLSAYKENSKTLKSLIKHSQSKSQSEPSILLQYLRLSLLAYNQRPGSEQSKFTLLSCKQVSTNEVIAECSFKVNDASDRFIQIPAKIVFELGDFRSPSKTTHQTRLYLQKVYISDHMVYGWWQK